MADGLDWTGFLNDEFFSVPPAEVACQPAASLDKDFRSNFEILDTLMDDAIDPDSFSNGVPNAKTAAMSRPERELLPGFDDAAPGPPGQASSTLDFFLGDENSTTGPNEPASHLIDSRLLDVAPRNASDTAHNSVCTPQTMDMSPPYTPWQTPPLSSSHASAHVYPAMDLPYLASHKDDQEFLPSSIPSTALSSAGSHRQYMSILPKAQMETTQHPQHISSNQDLITQTARLLPRRVSSHSSQILHPKSPQNASMRSEPLQFVKKRKALYHPNDERTYQVHVKGVPQANCFAFPVQSNVGTSKKKLCQRSKRTCLRCSEQKLKCSGEFPCSNCQRVLRNAATNRSRPCLHWKACFDSDIGELNIFERVPNSNLIFAMEYADEGWDERNYSIISRYLQIVTFPTQKFLEAFAASPRLYLASLEHRTGYLTKPCTVESILNLMAEFLKGYTPAGFAFCTELMSAAMFSRKVFDKVKQLIAASRRNNFSPEGRVLLLRLLIMISISLVLVKASRADLNEHVALALHLILYVQHYIMKLSQARDYQHFYDLAGTVAKQVFFGHQATPRRHQESDRGLQSDLDTFLKIGAEVQGSVVLISFAQLKTMEIDLKYP